MQFPLFIELELTTDCNAQCFFCPRQTIRNHCQMSAELVETLVSRVKEYGHIRDIVLCGRGEPLKHPSLPGIIGIFNRNDLPVSITTNGLLLTPLLAEKLVSRTLKEISISLHTLDSEKALRLGFADPAIVMDNLDYLASLNPSFKVEIQPVLCKQNETDVEDIRTWAEGHGFSLLFQKLHNRAGKLDSDCFGSSKVALPETFQYDIDLGNYKRERMQCSFPFVSCFVAASGDYYLCCQDFAGERPLGNIATMSIRQSLLSKAKLLRNDREICRSCRIN